jgi:lysophospholipase L1-like esterase
MKKTVSVSIIVMLTAIMNLYAAVITPNPIISRGKSVATSSGAAAYLVDNNFTGTNFNVANNTWIAINIGTGHSSVYMSWNNPAYTWSDVVAAAGSCKSTPSMPVNYTIQTSSNSTNGTDGTWTIATTVTGNNVTARGHVINSTGASWIKMNITTGGGQINEVEVFDLSSGGTDLWFFPGTSITANTYKGTPPAQDYADLIKASYPMFTPMMVRGGIPCISSNQLKKDINLYLASAGNAKYWAIEMGTNDAWGGSNGGVNNFKSNMQAVITACKNAGIQPIIARMLSTNESLANWQVHPDYLKAIDDLTTQNNLIPGPDLYTYFLSHSSEQNSDGVHPNAIGAASIQRLWAQKMGPLLYSSPLNPIPTVTITSPSNSSLTCAGTSITISANAVISSGTISKVDFYDGNTLLGTDNSSPYAYTWNGASAGTHTVRTVATSTAGMVSSAAFISFTVNALPAIDYFAQIDGGTWNQVTDVTVCAGSTVGLGPHPVETSGWNWTGPNGYTATVREITLSSIAVSQAGVYTANYTDANGCSNKSQITVTVNALPNAPSVSSSVPYCQNATAIPLTATGTALKWYTAATGGTGITTAPTPTITAIGTTNYYVSQITNSCESPRSLIAVTVNAVPVATISSTTSTTFCTGGSVLLTASAGSSYKWMNGNTQVGTAATYAASTTGNYTVEVTNANGCKATSASTSVTVNTLPNAPSVSSSIMYCQNTTATVLTAIGTGLKWYIAASGGTALATAPTPTTVSTGTINYYVSQTTNGCESLRALIFVTVNALPTATISSTTPTTFCTGGSVLLTASTGSSYKWMSGTIQVGTASTYSATTTGTYTVEVTNANNCKVTSTATTVMVNAAPTAPVVTSPVMYCQNASATALSATGTGLKWYTSASGGTGSATAPIPVTTNTGTINYYVSQTTNGCESTRTLISVTVNALPTATISSTTPTTFCTGGSVVLTSSAGSSYKWMNGNTQVGTAVTYTATAAGSYAVEVTNANNCKATSSATIVTVTTPTIWYADADGDGKGDAAIMQTACVKPAGYVKIAGDACPLDANKIAPGNCGCGNTESSCLDCAGIPNGTAFYDNCNICVGGTTANTACVTTATVNGTNANIKVIPQPFDANTSISIDNLGMIQSFTIISASGALVETRQGLNTDNITIGEALATGLYSVIITTEIGIYTTKIVKK